MAEWTVKRTETFLRFLKKHKNNHELLTELDKKLKRLISEPEVIGGNLAGNLSGHKSTRLSKKFRLVFSIDVKNRIVYLEAIDHRKDAY